MNFIALSFLFLTILATTLTLIQATPQGGGATQKKVPPVPPNQSTEPIADVKEICAGAKVPEPVCEDILNKAVGPNAHLKMSDFMDMTVRYAQAEYAATTNDVRFQMRDDMMAKPVKKALSFCLKMYMDMGDVQKSLYLAARSKKYNSPEALKFFRMAHTLLVFCEEGLVRAGSTGKKLDIYENYLDLDNIATVLEASLNYADSKRAGAI